jgi:hypothetical protein
MVIAPRFNSREFSYSLDSETGFRDGLAVVEIKGKFGYINKTGKIVIPAQYQYARDFNGELAYVDTDEKRYFIDKSGKVIYELKQ